MEFCHKCHVEYEPGDSCMCPIFYKWAAEHNLKHIPDYWWEFYEGPELYCPNCRSSHWPLEDCDCAIYRLDPRLAPDWWSDK